MSDYSLAHGGAVQAHSLANPSGELGRSRLFDPIDQDDFTFLHYGEVYCRSGILHQAVKDRRTMAAQSVPEECHVCEAMQAQTETISACFLVALHVTTALIGK